MPAELPPFHLAFAVHDLQAARDFYTGLLGCSEGRCDSHWVDFNLYGHQIVAHLNAKTDAVPHHNNVDNDSVPVPHFGVVLSMAQWHVLAQRLQAANVNFIIEPRIRFAGQPGEQATFFLLDPSGNALEFKAFANMDNLFQK